MAITGTFQADFSSFQSAVQGAEVKLRSFEENSNKVGSALSRMTNSLSGTKLIQDATIMSEAVDRVGGVSKLTEKELARVSATVGEAASKMRAMGVEVPPGMQKIAAEISNVQKSTSLADQAAGFLKSTFAQFTLASLASQAIQSVVAEVKEFISVGIRLPAVEASFERLTAAIHQNSGDMLAAMTESTKGMVSNFDLMLSANKAMLLGLPVTSESMGELSAAAVTLGRAMGLDATKSLNDLITALGRSSPMILDNLGLTVKVGEANEAYAAKLGKTSSQLTDAEKKLAFYEAAMEAARKKTEELGDQSQTLSEVMTTAWTTAGNAISEWAGLANVGIGQALSSWKEFGQFIVDSWTPSVLLSGGALVTAAERAREMAARTSDIHLAVENVISPLESYRAHLASVEAAAAALTSEQAALVLQGHRLGESVKDISTALELNERSVQATITAHKEMTTTLEAEAKAWAKTLSEIANTAGMEQMNDAIAAQARAVENLTGLWLMERDAFQLSQAAKQAALAQEAAFQAAIDASGSFIIVGQTPGAPAVSGGAGSLNQRGVQVFDGLMSILPGYETGGPVMKDGPIYAHAGEFVVPKGGAGTTVYNTFHIVDTEANIARRVSDHITRSVLQGRRMGSA